MGATRAQARTVVTREPGSTCRLSYDCGDRTPEPGDFVRTVPGGSCYRIDGVRQSPRIHGRFYLACTRLPRDAVQLDAPGVWDLTWYRR